MDSVIHMPEGEDNDSPTEDKESIGFVTSPTLREKFNEVEVALDDAKGVVGTNKTKEILDDAKVKEIELKVHPDNPSTLQYNEGLEVTADIKENIQSGHTPNENESVKDSNFKTSSMEDEEAFLALMDITCIKMKNVKSNLSYLLNFIENELLKIISNPPRFAELLFLKGCAKFICHYEFDAWNCWLECHMLNAPSLDFQKIWKTVQKYDWPTFEMRLRNIEKSMYKHLGRKFNPKEKPGPGVIKSLIEIDELLKIALSDESDRLGMKGISHGHSALYVASNERTYGYSRGGLRGTGKTNYEYNYNPRNSHEQCRKNYQGPNRHIRNNGRSESGQSKEKVENERGGRTETEVVQDEKNMFKLQVKERGNLSGKHGQLGGNSHSTRGGSQGQARGGYDQCNQGERTRVENLEIPNEKMNKEGLVEVQKEKDQTGPEVCTRKSEDFQSEVEEKSNQTGKQGQSVRGGNCRGRNRRLYQEWYGHDDRSSGTVDRKYDQVGDTRSYSNSNRRDQICYKCGRSGHLQRNCTKTGGGGDGKKKSIKY